MTGGILIYRVEGDSMLPTLLAGDYLLVRGAGASKRPPARGEVVVAALEGCERSILKRVVGLPGERITFSEGMLLINGRKLVEPYLRGLPPYLGLDNFYFTLGLDEYFLMGDNRAHSTDSRHYGPLRGCQIAAKAVWRVWPPSQWGKL
jgi:signal peptidase I